MGRITRLLNPSPLKDNGLQHWSDFLMLRVLPIDHQNDHNPIYTQGPALQARIFNLQEPKHPALLNSGVSSLASAKACKRFGMH